MTKIISKDDCIFCERAKALFDSKNVEYTELKLGQDITKDELLALLPDVKTVPQIWLTVSDAEIYIGGYDDLVKFYERP